MLKLSEAIRIGSLLNKQIQGKMWDGQGGTCAMGSAAWAAGINLDSKKIGKLLYDAFPILTTYWGLGDLGFPKRMPLAAAIALLNDTLGWSREEIADWVAMKENQLELKQKNLTVSLDSSDEKQTSSPYAQVC